MNGVARYGYQTPRDRYLTVLLDGFEYGLPLDLVRETVEAAVRPSPPLPPYVRGIAEVRDRAVPVVDLRRRMGLGESPRRPRASVVVIDEADGEGLPPMGLLVDAVGDVRDIEPEQLAPTEPLWHEPTGLVRAEASCANRYVRLLDVSAVLALSMTPERIPVVDLEYAL